MIHSSILFSTKATAEPNFIAVTLLWAEIMHVLLLVFKKWHIRLPPLHPKKHIYLRRQDCYYFCHSIMGVEKKYKQIFSFAYLFSLDVKSAWIQLMSLFLQESYNMLGFESLATNNENDFRRFFIDWFHLRLQRHRSFVRS